MKLFVTKQIYAVLDRRLGKYAYLVGGNYSIADIATNTWTIPIQQALHKIEIENYPNFKRWIDRNSQRPAVQYGIAVLADDTKIGISTEETYRNMFGSAQFGRI